MQVPERKIVFLTKQQREQLRLKKERQEAQKQQQYLQQCQETKRLYLEIGDVGEVKKDESKEQKRVDSQPKKRRRKNSEESQGSGDSRERSRDKQDNKKQKKTKTPKVYTQEEIEKKEQEEKLQAKMQYMGSNAQKKKMFSFSDRQKNVFNFQWSDKDDTTQNSSINYLNISEPKLMFGRGLQAGIDIEQQAIVTEHLDKYKNKHDKLMQHYSNKKYQEMTDRDWRIFREDNDIITKGGRVPNPIRNWTDAKLQVNVLDAVKRFGYETPKPIQMQAIPIGLQKKDLIALAPTGEGKTLAYLIPLVSYLDRLPLQTPMTCADGPYGLIMVPSRQLAEQIAQQFQKLTLGLGVRCQVMIGGKQIQFQSISLQKGCELVIGTPGRLKDLIEKRYMNLNQCSWVVLDEADKMVQMDMQPDVKFILDSIGVGFKSEDYNMALQQQQSLIEGSIDYRVTHLFSATMPEAIQKIARTYLRAYCFISIGQPGGGKKEIQQHIEMIGQQIKKKILGKVLRGLEPPIIIFVNQKRTCEVLAGVIQKWNYRCIEYHGGKSQEQRQFAVDSFKKGKYDILIATDLGSRGLHVQGVTAVINFDAPKTISSYVHRIGRTGRAGRKGKSYTFLTSNDEGIFYDIKEFLVKNNQTVPSELENHPASKVKPGATADFVPRRKQVVYSQ